MGDGPSVGTFCRAWFPSKHTTCKRQLPDTRPHQAIVTDPLSLFILHPTDRLYFVDYSRPSHEYSLRIHLSFTLFLFCTRGRADRVFLVENLYISRLVHVYLSFLLSFSPAHQIASPFTHLTHLTLLFVILLSLLDSPSCFCFYTPYFLSIPLSRSLPHCSRFNFYLFFSQGACWAQVKLLSIAIAGGHMLNSTYLRQTRGQSLFSRFSSQSWNLLYFPPIFKWKIATLRNTFNGNYIFISYLYLKLIHFL